MSEISSKTESQASSHETTLQEWEEKKEEEEKKKKEEEEKKKKEEEEKKKKEEEEKKKKEEEEKKKKEEEETKKRLRTFRAATIFMFAISAGFWGGALGFIASYGGQKKTDIAVTIFLGVSVAFAFAASIIHREKTTLGRLMPSFVIINIVLICVYWFVWRVQLRETNYEFSMDISASFLPMPTLAVLSQNRSDPSAIILRTDDEYPGAFLGFINVGKSCNDTRPYTLDSTTGCNASGFLKNRFASPLKISADSGMRNSFFANTTFFVQTFDLQRDILSTSAGQQVVYRVGTQSNISQTCGSSTLFYTLFDGTNVTDALLNQPLEIRRTNGYSMVSISIARSVNDTSIAGIKNLYTYDSIPSSIPFGDPSFNSSCHTDFTISYRTLDQQTYTAKRKADLYSITSSAGAYFSIVALLLDVVFSVWTESIFVPLFPFNRVLEDSESR